MLSFNVFSENIELPAKYSTHCSSVLTLQYLPGNTLVAVGTTVVKPSQQVQPESSSWVFYFLCKYFVHCLLSILIYSITFILYICFEMITFYAGYNITYFLQATLCLDIHDIPQPPVPIRFLFVKICLIPPCTSLFKIFHNIWYSTIHLWFTFKACMRIHHLGWIGLSTPDLLYVLFLPLQQMPPSDNEIPWYILARSTCIFLRCLLPVVTNVHLSLLFLKDCIHHMLVYTWMYWFQDWVWCMSDADFAITSAVSLLFAS